MLSGPYHSYESNETNARAQIMAAVHSDTFLEIERLHKASMITRGVTTLDKVFFWKYLGKLLKNAAGVDILAISIFMASSLRRLLRAPPSRQEPTRFSPEYLAKYD